MSQKLCKNGCGRWISWNNVSDASGNLVGNQNGYTTPSDLEPHHTGTFDIFLTKDTLGGTPSSFRLSYDWS
jgi:hypothetical protein